jgi:hypothetical protein
MRQRTMGMAMMIEPHAIYYESAHPTCQVKRGGRARRGRGAGRKASGAPTGDTGTLILREK